ncbi:hypothetical protein Apa02nite_014520 [Actinoplanes palleronii]|uniref:Uncharacterized protein n=1 Tax=Actinoplanes palleronii TaxID=113570 RepID=A0ABQ4B3V0_9ACTN|nr:hypothetical protein Apa02nite_014520 [Actinoplanes palleronii]
MPEPGAAAAKTPADQPPFPEPGGPLKRAGIRIHRPSHKPFINRPRIASWRDTPSAAVTLTKITWQF